MAKMTLEFPDHNRPVIVEVYVGPLPPGAELILETPGGVFVGAISFFGLSDNLQEGQPQIVVTREELPQDRISVVGRVVHNGVSRVATKDELQGVRLVAE